jgi:hypothetical protein
MFGRPPRTARRPDPPAPVDPAERAKQFDEKFDPMDGHRDNMPTNYKEAHQNFVHDLVSVINRAQKGEQVGDIFEPKRSAKGQEFDLQDADRYFTAENVDKVEPVGVVKDAKGGIRAAETFRITMKDGKQFLYKIQEQEWKNEFQFYALDRVLGLNMAPAVTLKNMGIGLFRQLYIDGEGNPAAQLEKTSLIDDLITKGKAGGGHIAEWVPVDPNLGGASGDPKKGELFDNQQKRHNVYSVALLDLLTINGDRHGYNWKPDAERGVVAIDNGYAGGGPTGRLRSDPNAVGEIDAKLAGPGGGPRLRFRVSFKQGFAKGCQTEGITKDEIKQEVADWFDAHWDGDKVAEVVKASGYSVRNRSYLASDKKDELRGGFVEKIMNDLATDVRMAY